MRRFKYITSLAGDTSAQPDAGDRTRIATADVTGNRVATNRVPDLSAYPWNQWRLLSRKPAVERKFLWGRFAADTAFATTATSAANDSTDAAASADCTSSHSTASAATAAAGHITLGNRTSATTAAAGDSTLDNGTAAYSTVGNRALDQGTAVDVPFTVKIHM